jgi:hypothetical protein
MAILADGSTCPSIPPKVVSSSSVQTRKPLFLLASQPDRKIKNFQNLKIEDLLDNWTSLRA